MYTIEGIKKEKKYIQEKIDREVALLKGSEQELNRLSKIESILEESGVEEVTMSEFYILQLMQDETLSKDEKRKMIGIIESIETRELELNKAKSKPITTSYVDSYTGNVWYTNNPRGTSSRGVIPEAVREEVTISTPR